MKKKIKLFDPIIGNEEKESVMNVLKSHFWASGSGEGHVQEFENKFKNYVNSRDCIAVSSGTAALYLALSMEKIENKEVILPSLSFVSTAQAVIANKAKPVFVDIELDTLCLDVEKIEDAVSKSTKMVLPVHFAGIPAKLNKIQTICKKNNLTLIEDAAHAAGSSYNNKKIGSHGKFVCFSFHPVKNLAMPTGGLISINDKNFKKISKELFAKRWCGITDRAKTKYDVKQLGWNYYMNELSAAIGLIQLKKLEKLNKIRKNNAEIYSEELRVSRKMKFDKNSSYHFYWILVKNREKLRKELSEEGIETGTHYQPIHKFHFFNKKIKLPNTEYASKSIITLPTHPNLSTNDLQKIIKIINKNEH